MSYYSLEDLKSKNVENGKENNIFKPAIIVFGFLVICVAITIHILFFSINVADELGQDRKETVVDTIIKWLIYNQSELAVPTRYSVPDRYYLPPSDQSGRGVCWAFATIFLLESQYRANGIEKGYLNSSDFVTFSKQAYSKYLLNKCQQHPEVSPCKHGGFGKKPITTDDHKIDSIIYFLREFTELSKSVLPEKVCPYAETEEGIDICDGMDIALKQNPIEFNISSFEAANSIEAAKRLLVKKQRPIGLGTPIPDYMFYAPCDSSNYSSFPVCKNNETRCPEGFESEFCAPIMIDSRIRDGTFVYLEDFSRVVYAGGHAVNVVGYNDDWLYKSRLVSEQSMQPLRGGFIIHNSWRAPGHSVDYLMGRQSEENENVICPNHLNPMNWIPAREDCIVANKGDYTKCGTSFRFVRGKGITNHTDLLKCIDTTGLYCNPDRNYVLGQMPDRDEVNAQPLFNGLDRVQIISWDKTDTQGTTITSDFIDYFPFWAIKKIFEPVELVENDPIQCGYWMYPYDTTTIVNKKTWSLIDTFHVIDIEFNFTESSYVQNQVSDKNYTLIRESTSKFEKTEFDGPLPYKYVY